MESLINEKEKLLSTLKISVVMVEKELNVLKKSEAIKFTERELNFSKDADKALFSKYKNKKYVPHKKVILEKISKRFEKLKTQRIQFKEKYLMYEAFFNELEKV